MKLLIAFSLVASGVLSGIAFAGSGTDKLFEAVDTNGSKVYLTISEAIKVSKQLRIKTNARLSWNDRFNNADKSVTIYRPLFFHSKKYEMINPTEESAEGFCKLLGFSKVVDHSVHGFPAYNTWSLELSKIGAPKRINNGGAIDHLTCSK